MAQQVNNMVKWFFGINVISPHGNSVWEITKYITQMKLLSQKTILGEKF